MFNQFDLDELSAMTLRNGVTIGETLIGKRIIDEARSQIKEPRMIPVGEILKVNGDMGPSTMGITIQPDGDVIVSVSDPDGTACIEFCTMSAGGKNPEIHQTLFDLAASLALKDR
jgi:hypothetical protein